VLWIIFLSAPTPPLSPPDIPSISSIIRTSFREPLSVGLECVRKPLIEVLSVTPRNVSFVRLSANSVP
jgi:hypothetical protein